MSVMLNESFIFHPWLTQRDPSGSLVRHSATRGAQYSLMPQSSSVEQTVRKLLYGAHLYIFLKEDVSNVLTFKVSLLKP